MDYWFWIPLAIIVVSWILAAGEGIAGIFIRAVLAGLLFILYKYIALPALSWLTLGIVITDITATSWSDFWAMSLAFSLPVLAAVFLFRLKASSGKGTQYAIVSASAGSCMLLLSRLLCGNIPLHALIGAAVVLLVVACLTYMRLPSTEDGSPAEIPPHNLVSAAGATCFMLSPVLLLQLV